VLQTLRGYYIFWLKCNCKLLLYIACICNFIDFFLWTSLRLQADTTSTASICCWAVALVYFFFLFIDLLLPNYLTHPMYHTITTSIFATTHPTFLSLSIQFTQIIIVFSFLFYKSCCWFETRHEYACEINTILLIKTVPIRTSFNHNCLIV
jgi:formate-dependent nitrite reductase membrane component NrfD